MRKRPKLSTADFVQSQTDMPPISLMDLPYIEISGQNHIEIEGIYKITEYNSNTIKLKFKRNVVCFMGVDLHMQNFSDKNTVIKGKISSIVFE